MSQQGRPTHPVVTHVYRRSDACDSWPRVSRRTTRRLRPAGPAGVRAATGVLTHVGGLELPYLDEGAVEDRWQPGCWPGDRTHVVTAVPATAIRAGHDPSFGLASADEAGRRAALEVVRRIRTEVERLAQRLGRAAVTAVEIQSVEIQSAPARTGAPDRLAGSLSEIAGWNWSGARIVVEHCDAVVDSHEPEKGFLALDDEIRAIAVSGVDAGIAVNWGRSVLEARSESGAPAHVADAARASLLSGMMFSGVAPTQVGTAPAWADAHLPPRPHEPASLLGTEQMRNTLAAASRLDGLLFAGAKVSARRSDTTAAARADGVCAAMAMVAAEIDRVRAS